jgi:hypothetical protein
LRRHGRNESAKPDFVNTLLELLWEWYYYFAAILRSIGLVMAR